MAESFGCCSSYVDCSDNRSCIHAGNSEYEGCQYRKNLEIGQIFYGKNKFNNKGEDETMENLMKISVEVKAPELIVALNNLAGALSGVRNSKTAAISVKEEKIEKTNEAEKKPEPVEADLGVGLDLPNEAEASTETVTYTLEEVRAKLAAISKAGKSTEMKQLISSFGVSKLTDIPSDKYPELMEKAGALI